ncbi:HD-GYP domain-containing protein [Glaciecola sp. 1036]|uniref:HD-GYP domain-containing protein n=1 Tax=Alteromonadaceae TaxID=72275 RepID=UPI003CFCA714
MKKVVPIDQLCIGMFLVRVTDASSNIQVKSQGVIRSEGTIDTLKNRGVLAIEVDLDKSEVVLEDDEVQVESEQSSGQVTKKTAKKTVSFETQQKDLAAADRLYSEACAVQSRFVKQLRNGSAPDFQDLNNLSQQIIDSVFDNKDALSCLVMLKESNEYLVQHSLNCSILLSIFARHKELSPSEVEDLTLGGLLMDVGMALLPPELVGYNADYSGSDLSVMQSHVDIGLEVVERFSDLPPMINEIIQNHHERIDGSGFPKGIFEPSLYAQMAGIVDTYDAMLTQSQYRMAGNTQETLNQMKKSGVFDNTLIDEFIAAIGLYPVGTLVLLKSDKLALVTQANEDDHCKPKVMVFYHVKNKHHIPIKIVDLKRNTDKIKVAVRPEEFDINLPKFFRTAVLPF